MGMSGVNDVVILTFLIVLTTISAGRCDRVERAFRKADIVPDVIFTPPEKFLAGLYYEGLTFVNLGNELTPTDVKKEPFVDWIATYDGYYLLMMVDPDAPSRSDPTMRALLHWMVGNICRNMIRRGQVLAEFIGAAPGLHSGFHRYVFLLYKQPGIVDFGNFHIANNTIVGRTNFNVTEFSQKYDLGTPVAGNFFYAQWDEYVPTVQKQLGIN